jgi:tetratricopeptide (TPR) repeat protein
MNQRRASWAIAVVVLGGLTAAGYLWWRAAAQRAIVAASIPHRPDLSALPAEMTQRVGACERRAQAGPDRIAALGELSRLYHANGFFPEASQCYQGLLQVEAADPYWPYRLATIIAGYGQLDDALPLWRRAVKLAPDYVPARLRLGDTLLKTNQNAEAAKVYAAVLEREPRNPYALLGLARIDIDAGRWDAARERLEVVVQQSKYGIGYDLLPTVYEHLGETARADAIRAREKASGAFYDVPDPWIDELIYDCYDTYRISAAAGTADHVGDTRAAIRILERALTLAPDKAVFQFQMGTFWLKQRDYANARRCFERCTVLAPDFSDGWAQLADLHMKLGDRATSERVVAAGLANCPNSPGLHLQRANQLTAAGRFPEAIEQYKEAIRLRPEEAEALIDLAEVYFQLDRTDEGIAEIYRALKAEPEHPGALSILAFNAINNGDEAGAREWLRHVKQQPRVAQEIRDMLVKAFVKGFGRSPD